MTRRETVSRDEERNMNILVARDGSPDSRSALTGWMWTGPVGKDRSANWAVA
jgi:hypothetical protein